MLLLYRARNEVFKDLEPAHNIWHNNPLQWIPNSNPLSLIVILLKKYSTDSCCTGDRETEEKTNSRRGFYMSLKNTNRNITFRGAGEHDVSEVKIESGDHAVQPGDAISRITYTFSYRSPDMISPEQEKQFADDAVEAIREKIAQAKSQ